MDILDNTVVCPLCQNVLETDGEKMINMYPDISKKNKLFKLLTKIFYLVCFVAELILIFINMLIYNGLWWCVICGGAMIFACFTLTYSTRREDGYLTKILVESILGLLLVILIDITLGYRGWSLSYAIPGGILLVDTAMLVLMLIEFNRWQMYIIYQLFLLVISVGLVILCNFSVIDKPLVSFIAFGVSLIIFIGTLLLGEKKATSELYRRFKI